MLVAAVLGGHVTELFDRWDHTLETGQEVDYSVVLVAACAALALAVAVSAGTLVRRPAARRKPAGSCVSSVPRTFIPETALVGPSPPTLPLRI